MCLHVWVGGSINTAVDQMLCGYGLICRLCVRPVRN